MKFRARKQIRLGPLYWNFSFSNGQLRYTSWGVKFGRYTHNFTRRVSSFDTPGPGGFSHQHGGRNR